jgi:NADH:ubiquinone oxidoreductase subunit 4 (subunit M)
MLLFAAIVLVLGLFPALVLDLIQPACAAWTARVD